MNASEIEPGEFFLNEGCLWVKIADYGDSGTVLVQRLSNEFKRHVYTQPVRRAAVMKADRVVWQMPTG